MYTVKLYIETAMVGVVSGCIQDIWSWGLDHILHPLSLCVLHACYGLQ